MGDLFLSTRNNPGGWGSLGRKLAKKVASAAAAAVVAAGVVAAPAAASAAPGAPAAGAQGCSYGSGGPKADALCWALLESARSATVTGVGDAASGGGAASAVCAGIASAPTDSTAATVLAARRWDVLSFISLPCLIGVRLRMTRSTTAETFRQYGHPIDGSLGVSRAPTAPETGLI